MLKACWTCINIHYKHSTLEVTDLLFMSMVQQMLHLLYSLHHSVANIINATFAAPYSLINGQSPLATELLCPAAGSWSDTQRLINYSIGSRALSFSGPLLSLSVNVCFSVCGCACPQLWGQISRKPKELAGKILWGAYRNVVRGYRMVTSPMTSRDPMTSYPW